MVLGDGVGVYSDVLDGVLLMYHVGIEILSKSLLASFVVPRLRAVFGR
jgi:hypothetical protein